MNNEMVNEPVDACDMVQSEKGSGMAITPSTSIGGELFNPAKEFFMGTLIAATDQEALTAEDEEIDVYESVGSGPLKKAFRLDETKYGLKAYEEIATSFNIEENM